MLIHEFARVYRSSRDAKFITVSFLSEYQRNSLLIMVFGRLIGSRLRRVRIANTSPFSSHPAFRRWFSRESFAGPTGTRAQIV